MSEPYKGTIIDELMALVESAEHSVILRRTMTRSAINAAYRAGRFDGLLEMARVPSPVVDAYKAEFERTSIDREVVGMGEGDSDA